MHCAPRAAMFSSFPFLCGPGRKTRLHSIQQTIGIDETGLQFNVSDDWTVKPYAHRALSARWTGITIFRIAAHDDPLYRGDQPRQRERAEGEVSTSTRPI